MQHRERIQDLVIAGGGLAGCCAALAAARQGLRTALVHDRPVLGGNASSEIRVAVHGAAQFHAYARETGIIHEILAAERARNHEPILENGGTNSVLDLVLYDLCQQESNLTLLLNTAVQDVELEGGVSGLARDAQRPPPGFALGYAERPACAESSRIAALVATTNGAETRHVLRAPLFVDATGDALVAHLAGCAWRMGSEGREQTGEGHAPERGSTDTMGNSIHIRARDTGRDAPFSPPVWAVQHSDPSFFAQRGRHANEPRGGYWWLEIGVPWHTIHDNETIRHELTRHALGVWDWMKNHDPVMRERCRTWALDWIGQVPGKRDSRRVLGLHLLTEQELHGDTVPEDTVGHGGWFIDLHTPGGLLAPTSEPHAAAGYKDESLAALGSVGPWALPLRCLIARDVDNLFLAGRCMSFTHAAMGSARVMGTTALMGQAVGTAAALVHAHGGSAHAAVALAPAVRRRLQRDGVWIPRAAERESDDLAPLATATASSQQLSHGIGTDDVVSDGGLGRHWCRNADNRSVALDRQVAQLIACAGGRLDHLEICLDNKTDAAVDLPLSLWRLDHAHDARPEADTCLARTRLRVPPGTAQWLTWPVALAGLPAGYLRLDAAATPGLAWRSSTGLLPGQWAWRRLGATGTKLRRLGDGWCQAFRIAPAQAVYPPREVLAGGGRPDRSTGTWRSDPGQPMPQWLELAWPTPVTIAQIEIQHGAQLLREVHAEPPYYRHPPCARDYRLLAWTGTGWQELRRITGNFQRQRRHCLESAIRTDRLRVAIDASNGDAAVEIAALRVYATPGREG